MVAGNNSAGIVLHRVTDGVSEILLVHPGGPFWAKKDEHGWSIPKGEFEPDAEPAMTAARREFEEELGHPVPNSTPDQWIELPTFKAGKKTIHSWVVEGDLDPTTITSNHFEMEWPPRSGTMASFPEVDRACWFTIEQARSKLHKGQLKICELITAAIGG